MAIELPLNINVNISRFTNALVKFTNTKLIANKYEVDVFDGPLSKPIQVTVRDYEIMPPNLFQIIPSLTSDHECLETLFGSAVTGSNQSRVPRYTRCMLSRG